MIAENWRQLKLYKKFSEVKFRDSLSNILQSWVLIFHLWNKVSLIPIGIISKPKMNLLYYYFQPQFREKVQCFSDQSSYKDSHTLNFYSSLVHIDRRLKLASSDEDSNWTTLSSFLYPINKNTVLMAHRLQLLS